MKAIIAKKALGTTEIFMEFEGNPEVYRSDGIPRGADVWKNLEQNRERDQERLRIAEAIEMHHLRLEDEIYARMNPFSDERVDATGVPSLSGEVLEIEGTATLTVHTPADRKEETLQALKQVLEILGNSEKIRKGP